MQNTLSNPYETPQPPRFKNEHSNSQFRASSAGGSGAAGSVALLRTFVEQARANAARFEAKLDAALQKLDEILAQLASQDRKLDHITDQLARLQEPSPGPKADMALRAGSLRTQQWSSRQGLALPSRKDRRRSRVESRRDRFSLWSALFARSARDRLAKLQADELLRLARETPRRCEISLYVQRVTDGEAVGQKLKLREWFDELRQNQFLQPITKQRD